ncbi:MAG: EamA family transporter [Caldimicrobium thiodismutans]
MLWILYAILSGFFVALSDALSKKYFAKEGFIEMTVARTLGAFPFLFPFFLYFLINKGAYFYFTPNFIFVTLILLFLEIIATLFYTKGIEISPLSASLPFLSFTPVFIIFTGFFLLGERVSVAGAIGIFLIVVGAYFIHLPRISRGFLAPFKGIWEEKGSLYLLITALIYGITSVLGKMGLILSDPLFFAAFYFSLLSLATPLTLKIFYRVQLFSFCRKRLKEIFLVGGTQALMCFFHMLALNLVETAYMIALKRTSILFAVIFGWYFFRERHIGLRLGAAFLMFLGILLIAFFR